MAPRTHKVLVSRKVVFTKKVETINIAMAAALVDSGRYNNAVFRGHPMNDVLRSFIKRARPDASGTHGTIILIHAGLVPSSIQK